MVSGGGPTLGVVLEQVARHHSVPPPWASLGEVLMRLLVITGVFALACASGAERNEAADTSGPTETSDVGTPEPAVAPEYPDPPWTEPPPPSEAEVLVALGAARGRAEAALGAALPEVQAAVDAHGPGVAAAFVGALELEAALWVLTAPDADISARVSAAGVLALSAETAAEAELLARAALAHESTTPTLTTTRRVAAAHANLGAARLLLGNAPGAVAAYRGALDAFPTDPHYLIGLAAALHAAGNDVPALLAARHAASLGGPAAAWVKALTAAVSQGVELAPGTRLETKADGHAFPAVGAQWLGMTVLSADTDGTLTMSAPPFEPRGVADLQRLECAEVTEGVGGATAEFPCPEGGVSGEPIGAWYGPQLGGIRMSVPSGTLCDEALVAAFDPEPTPLRFDTSFGYPDPLEAYAAGLHLAVIRRLDAIADTYGVGGLASAAAACGDKGPVQPKFEELDQVARADCGPCLCANDPDCADCWSEARKACDSLYDLAIGLVASEEARARRDDAPLRRSVEHFLTLFPPLWAAARGVEACDAECGATLAEHPVLTFLDTLGGRVPQYLTETREQAGTAWERCVARIPPYCPERGPAPPGGSSDTVACLCLGVGPLEYCVAADGTVTITVTAIAAVGLQANFDAASPSVRLGLGAGAGFSVGPASVGVSAMAWWDASTNAWVSGDLSADFGLETPGGGGVGGAFSCDAWKSGQELLDGDSHIVEATPAPPGE